MLSAASLSTDESTNRLSQLTNLNCLLTLSKPNYLKGLRWWSIVLYRKPISELWSVTCHIRSHSVTCHPTLVNVPHAVGVV